MAAQASEGGHLGEARYRYLVVSVKRLCVIVGALHELTYADLAGERWYTTGLYLTKRATGDVPNFVEMKVGRVPGDGIVRPAKMPEVPASLAADEE